MKTLSFFALLFYSGISFAQNLQWEKNLGGSANEFVTKIIKSDDGGFVFCSSSASTDNDVIGNHGIDDVWVVSLDNNGEKVWQTCLGGINAEAAHWISAVPGDGYIVAATTFSNGPKNASQVFGNHGGQDVWLIKIDERGEIEWRRCYGGCEQDDIRCVIPTSDGGYIAVGATFSYNNGDVYGLHVEKDGWIIKVDKHGELLWQQTVGGTGNNDYLYQVVETADKHFVVAGASTSADGDLAGSGNKGLEDLWVFEIDDNGNFVWSKTYGGSASDGARNVMIAADGSLFLGGFTQSQDGDISNHYGLSDVWVLHLSKTGNLIWEKSFGGSQIDNGYELFQRTENDFIIVGETGSFDGDVSNNHGGRDIWLVKFDKDGNLKKEVCFGGASTDQARTAIRGNGDTEIIIGGVSNSSDGDVSQNYGGSDAWILKLDLVLGLKPETPGHDLIKFEVSPNPARSLLTISTNASGKKWIEVYDLTGRLVNKIETENETTLLETGTLPSGKYMIRLVMEKTGAFVSSEFVKA